MNTQTYTEELSALKTKFRSRDHRMYKIFTARQPGGLRLVYPDLFPTEGPYQEPMVANMVDIAARDTAEVLAPPPTFSCSSAMNVSDAARKFADRRTKIAYGYFDASKLSTALLTMADQYVTYGFAIGVVRIDTERKTPVIQFLDPMGCYPLFDSWGRTRVLYEVRRMTHQEVDAQWPVLGDRLRREFKYSPTAQIEIVRRYSSESDVMFTPEYPDLTLMEAKNPIGEPMVHTFVRPGLSEEMIGQFDDVLAVQVAKARFALLTLEAAQKSIQAPIAMPVDVQEINTGADATIRSQTPEKIRRIGLEVPPAAFAQQEVLDGELRRGSRYPEARTGNTDASVVTGRGVQALMSGFDTQVKTGQAIFALGMSFLMSTAFKVDEAVWPELERSVNGNINGTPYSLKYKPSRDIKGDYSIDVQYGLMAGLQANQALVFGLQARGDKLISRDFLRRQMPFALDAADEEAKVDVEDLRDSLKLAYESTAQAIPQMTMQGGNPTELLMQMAAVINARQRGIPVEQAIAEAFATPEPAPAAAPEPAMPPGMEGLGASEAGAGMPMPGPVADPMAAAGGGEGGGKRQLMQLMASLGRSGPNLQASVQRRMPIG